ncbi:hypothetical protein GDO86_019343, partial [Hymenochirus boettgeri]
SPDCSSPSCTESTKEDSLEIKTASFLTLGEDSGMTVKGNKDVIMMNEGSSLSLMKPLNNRRTSEPEAPIISTINTRHSDPTKPTNVEKEWKWKVPETPNHIFQTEGKRKSVEPSAYPISRRLSPPGTSVKKYDPLFLCRTPVNKSSEDYMNCFRTPVVNTHLGPLSTPNNLLNYQQPQIPAVHPCFNAVSIFFN